MIACDICKCKATTIQVRITRLEVKKGKEQERVMLTVPVDLCGKHIDTFHQEVSNLVIRLRSTNA